MLVFIISAEQIESPRYAGIYDTDVTYATPGTSTGNHLRGRYFGVFPGKVNEHYLLLNFELLPSSCAVKWLYQTSLLSLEDCTTSLLKPQHLQWLSVPASTFEEHIYFSDIANVKLLAATKSPGIYYCT